MKKSAVLSVLILGLMSALAAAPAFASDVLYNNTLYSFQAGQGNVITYSDEFTLSSAPMIGGFNSDTITGLMLGLWVDNNATIQSVSWEITLAPFDNAPIAFGTANLLNTTYESSFEGFKGYQVQFGIPDTTLPNGNYWLQITGASAPGSDYVGWDLAQDLTPADYYYNGTINKAGNSETFEILGYDDNVPSTPEPSSFLLLGSGLAGLAGLIKRKLAA